MRDRSFWAEFERLQKRGFVVRTGYVDGEHVIYAETFEEYKLRIGEQEQ